MPGNGFRRIYPCHRINLSTLFLFPVAASADPCATGNLQSYISLAAGGQRALRASGTGKIYEIRAQITAVPEPPTFVLLTFGVFIFIGYELLK